MELAKSTRAVKKYMVKVDDKIVHFGAKGYEDFTTHGDESRKERYLARHKTNEDWTKSGIDTAGFWSRWLLWNKPTIKESVKDIEKRFGVKISYK
jgi:hypothetical protein